MGLDKPRAELELSAIGYRSMIGSEAIRADDRETASRSTTAPPAGEAVRDPHRGLGAGPSRRPRRDLAPGPCRPRRPASAVPVRLLRLQARPVRPDVRRRQPPAPGEGQVP